MALPLEGATRAPGIGVLLEAGWLFPYNELFLEIDRVFEAA